MRWFFRERDVDIEKATSRSPTDSDRTLGSDSRTSTAMEDQPQRKSPLKTQELPLTETRFREVSEDSWRATLNGRRY